MATWLKRSGATLAAATAASIFVPTASAAQTTQHANPKTPVFTSQLMNYQVKAGDTLSSIAIRTGTTVDALARENNLRNPNLIFPGQKLRIPSPVQASMAKKPAQAPVTTPTQAAPTTSSTTYTVKAGDTLGKIARQHNTTVAKLASDNKIANPNLIHVGQKLTIGTAQADTPAQAAKPAKPAQSAPAAAPKQAAPTTSSTTYTVKAGDTLGKIARQHNTTVAKLASDNKISNPNRIRVGQRLSIGAAATSAAQSPSVTSTKPQLVKNNFPGYTYPDETVAAANENKHALLNAGIPSRAQTQQSIIQVANQMGVDPKLALAHAYVESGFDATAVSPANAIGTMQVIPSSGVWASQLVGRDLNLLDPYDNIVAGVAIIRQLQASASSFDEGIAGYYQGLAGVRKYGMRSDTVTYVAKVKSAMNRF
ncbi:LysM repeat protein [Trueperella bonasi]|uniref:LysM repeat protein n=1 Tax=Trueperella bonasi TaxID=312286 RepID=A0ABT9NI88_9ACTO|nr:lytic transglycosylase domain-containing protein [Trueperella bonasi]MDP9807113.1 LysM repeat protein [Trueperella bonasi]